MQRHTMTKILNHSRSTALERSAKNFTGRLKSVYVVTILALSSAVVYTRHLFSPREGLCSGNCLYLYKQEGQDGGHLVFPIGTTFAIFDLQVLMILNKFQVNWPFSSEEEVKKRFSRWPSWISDRNYFNYFCSTSHPYASYQVSSQLAFRFRRRSEK